MDPITSFQDNIPVGLFRSTVEGEVLYANPALLRIFGYNSREEFSAAPRSEIYYDMSYRTELLQRLKEDGVVMNMEVQYKRNDGTSFWGSYSAQQIRGSDGKILYNDGMIENITQQKEAARSLKESLREKEILLREIHHRVKNNLQVISSLVRLQRYHSSPKTLEDSLTETQARIRAIALVHELLYQSETIAQISLETYIQELCHSISVCFEESGFMPRFTYSLSAVTLTIDDAIPVGLILNELITNTIQHGYPEDFPQQKEIQVTTERRGNEIYLRYRDNGRGLDAEGKLEESTSLGTQLVQSLLEQSQGRLLFFGACKQKGFCCELLIPLTGPRNSNGKLNNS